ncbi:ATP-binding protein [Flavobacterium sp. DG1-102-2]|uniref:ATP-binding protein n=1 Tax=Flavobacterium sp. DG1-102-2 TaxID=3081663 RepID=UPI00294A12E1|nr:ATP-binding protein [Flavobacterium sp. DG1-102-2]MDV6170202.1 ATP-binding protein [Flavobacterium sp. DG1-102-2]
MPVKRAWSVDNVVNKKFFEIPLPEVWERFIGKPEASGVWIIWGESGSGKTALTMAAAKILAMIFKVAFDSLEMGTSKALYDAIIKYNMREVKKNFLILDRESIEDLKIRLRKKQAPRVVIIDSVQYADLTKSQYKALKEEFYNVLFIFISHAEGKLPKGALAGFIRYDADIKIRVEGYKAFPVSRFGGGEPYIIWPEGAAQYWADIA